jgi:hypothetical protein
MQDLTHKVQVNIPFPSPFTDRSSGLTDPAVMALVDGGNRGLGNRRIGDIMVWHL